MRVLAFDVSLHRTGVCHFVDGLYTGHDVIETGKQPRYEQLGWIEVSARGHIRRFGPNIVAIETSIEWQRGGHDKPKLIEALAQARAAILIASSHEVIDNIIEMDPHTVRETVCGNRNASKQQVQAALRMLGFELPMIEKTRRIDGRYEIVTEIDPDKADALCLAIAVYSEERLKAMAV